MEHLSFKQAVEIATNPEVLPGVNFVALKDLRSHPNFRTCESLEKAQAALRKEGKLQPVRAEIMEDFCGLINDLAQTTRNGYSRLATNQTSQVIARLRVFKVAQGVRTEIPAAVRHLLDHIKLQDKASRAVQAHVGRTMIRVSDFSQKRKAERDRKAKARAAKGRKNAT